jgi:hypothetical protein
MGLENKEMPPVHAYGKRRLQRSWRQAPGRGSPVVRTRSDIALTIEIAPPAVRCGGGLRCFIGLQIQLNRLFE